MSTARRIWVSFVLVILVAGVGTGCDNVADAWDGLTGKSSTPMTGDEVNQLIGVPTPAGIRQNLIVRLDGLTKAEEAVALSPAAEAFNKANDIDVPDDAVTAVDKAKEIEALVKALNVLDQIIRRD